MSDCKNCKHLVMYDYKNKSYSCESRKCEFEPEEQEPILDKIRDEIKQTSSRYVMSRERGYEGQVEWSDRLIKESEVLGILDKYKAESEAEE